MDAALPPLTLAPANEFGDSFAMIKNGKQEFSVVVERDEAGYYVATVPALPGCHTQARSLDKNMKRVREGFASMPILEAPLRDEEVMGTHLLKTLSDYFFERFGPEGMRGCDDGAFTAPIPPVRLWQPGGGTAPLAEAAFQTANSVLSLAFVSAAMRGCTRLVQDATGLAHPMDWGFVGFSVTMLVIAAVTVVVVKVASDCR